MKAPLLLAEILATITDDELKKKIHTLYTTTYRESRLIGMEDQSVKCGCQSDD